MRAATDAIVDEQVRVLTRAWVRAWDDLAGIQAAAIDDLIAASAGGRWPGRTVIDRADRANRALAAAHDRLERLSAMTGDSLRDVLPALVAESAQHQAAILATQMPPGVATQAVLTTAFNRVDPGSLEAIVQRSLEQITALTWPLAAEATAVMKQVLVRGVALGYNPRKAAAIMLQNVEGAFNGGLSRALNIARTEMLDAHRAASKAQWEANNDLVTEWQWSTTLDLRTCESCLAMHGKRFPTSVQGPEDHQQGRCVGIPVTRSWAELGFDVPEPASVLPDARAWFDGLPESDQLRVMGPARLEMLKSGQITWDDLATRRVTDGWRDSFGPTPVHVLRNLATANA